MLIRHRGLRLGTLALALAAGCSGPAPRSLEQPAPPTANATPVRPSAGPALETISLRVREGTALAFDLSPDGQWVVFDLLGQLWRFPSSGGEASPLTDAVRDTAEDLDPSWSPDGRTVVFRAERGGRTGLWSLGIGSYAPRQLTQLEHPDGFHGSAAWSPDGGTIAFTRVAPAGDSPAGWRSSVALLSAADGSVRDLRAPDAPGDFVREPAWDPGGGRIVVVAVAGVDPRGGRLWAVPLDGGEVVPLTEEGSVAFAPAFSPDGGRLAYLAPDAAGRWQVWVRDLASGGATKLSDQGDVSATRVRWTPGGDTLLYSADGRLWKVPADGGDPSEVAFVAELSIARPARRVEAARFPEAGVPQRLRGFFGLALAPDARSAALLALDTMWVMPIGGAPRAVSTVPIGARHPAWSAEGREVTWAAGPWGREDLYATDVETGATRRVTALAGREDFPAYSPDGRHLAFLHAVSEDSTVLRIAPVRAAPIDDFSGVHGIPVEPGAEAYWSPESDAILLVSGGFEPDSRTRGELISLDGGRRPVENLPDSPLFLQWTRDGLVWTRHDRLWRGRFDGDGTAGPPAALGPEPAMYASAARDGTTLFVSADGLRLRHADGRRRSLGWPLSYVPSVAPPVLIRGARVIDGTGTPASEPRDVLIEGGRIRRIADAGTIVAPSATVIDGSGRFLIPGLVDLHAHSYRPDLLPAFPYFGVTTIRDQGSDIGPLVAHADAIAAGLLDGPRVAFGGFQFYTDWAYDGEQGRGIEPEADPEHVSRSVSLQAAFGAQHLKARTFRRWDIHARLIAEGHARGLRVTGHCAHPLPLIAAGIDAKEHGGFCGPRGSGPIHEDLVELFRAAGVAVVPTIVYGSLALRLADDPGLLEGDPELAPFLPSRDDFAWMLNLDSAGRRRAAGWANVARDWAFRLWRAGVPIGVGSDVWQVPIGAHLELEELVAAGIPPLEALRAATSTAARIIGGEGDFGTVAEGMIADLVLLDADPSADVRNTRRIAAVLQAGRLVDRDALLASFRASHSGLLR